MAFLFPLTLAASNATLLGWNNLGMHCMDSDYSVFSILPPYNTIECQLIVGGQLVTNGTGYTVTYQAVADPSGSVTSTAVGKGNFYDFAQALYGVALAPDAGLLGWNMPGTNNPPQSMLFEVTNQPAAGVTTPVNWFRAEGIPMSPYDDAHQQNPYPLMRLIAWNVAHQPIATNDIVLPVSDEMDCRACHASGSPGLAMPEAGWVWTGNPERDFRLNILRLHDERQFAQTPQLYADALAARGFNPQGLYRGVVADGKPVLCAACHASEALGAPSYGSIPALTTSIHGYHAHVLDPVLNTTLDSAANRAACYRCHPGSTTKCLRGAMGGAVAADGSMEMQCQSCHGNMNAVGATNRVGWFMEPNCQSCHTGTAAHNNGQIRFTSALDANGQPRVPVDTAFATTPNTPAAGLSMFRFSIGHGGLQCEACHGSTHAEFPSTHVNDNVRDIALQGHAGVMAECTACHTTSPSTITGGPHGMHPVGAAWVSSHHNVLENGQATRTQCQACHGTDYRGTVLSRMQADRTLSAFGTKTFFRGAIIGCYTCHNGPSNDDANSSAAPVVANVNASTTNDRAVTTKPAVTGTGAALRIISQPANGTVGLTNNVLTYFPDAGFTGTDTFTFAAYDGSKNSSLATGTVAVAQGTVSLGATANVPPTEPAGWPVAFAVVPVITNSTAPATFDWNFGDGSAHATNQFPTHIFAAPGTYPWNVSATVAGISTKVQGTIAIGDAVSLAVNQTANLLTVSWPATAADTVLETTPSLNLPSWSAVTNAVTAGSGTLNVSVPAQDTGFFRVRQAW